ncbi:unnamed protein product [Vitrella brassicaformis CCMP3155]|uniref:Autophagy-related protein 7 n=3 Tax=Vitrella brassicaformis TaxID=1169539 RepID=A0A0G4E8W6_VITBC|nr:unnamed protein product [Vitrella brassicaformis CCMP3155]|eukprot:CEL92350.1 unnamed protein product [Vitrella brassicaformis CCMP3155]
MAHPLSFEPPRVVVDISFWQELAAQKLDRMKLTTPRVPIVATMERPAPHSPASKDASRTSGQLRLTRSSFTHTSSTGEGGVATNDESGSSLLHEEWRGTLINVNTLEEFRSFDRKQLTDTVAAAIANGGAEGAAESDDYSSRRAAGDTAGGGGVRVRGLREMAPCGAGRVLVMLTFIDLKKYRVYYSIAFPVISPNPSYQHIDHQHLDQAMTAQDISAMMRQLKADHTTLKDGLFDVHVGGGNAGGAADGPWLGYVDSSTSAEAMGWGLRNVLFLLASKRRLYGRTIRILAFRDLRKVITHQADNEYRPSYQSSVYTVRFPPADAFTLPPPLSHDSRNGSSSARATCLGGWVRWPVADGHGQAPGHQQHKSTTVQQVNLCDYLDFTTIQANAVDLNVKLIKWRMVPQFDPERFNSMRFLLLGAGTLGCAIARALIAWGAKHITFVDSGNVAMSNPVRQSLFKHQDAAAEGGSGRPKVDAACEALREIRPDVDARGVVFEIPMPGHFDASAASAPSPSGSGAAASTSASIERSLHTLDELISEHDVVFMGTDSRESRWLPSFLIANKSWRAVRRQQQQQQQQTAGGGAAVGSEGEGGCGGVPLGITVALGFDSFLVLRHGYKDQSLACYFCNDLSAPRDTTSNRTLDQQCTVTRPGVSPMASALAVELLVTLSQHPHGFVADPSEKDTGSSDDSCLGACPHSIRGFIGGFRLVVGSSPQSPYCTCCSPAVHEAFEQNPIGMLTQVMHDPGHLESVSGLRVFMDKMSRVEEDVIQIDDEELCLL